MKLSRIALSASLFITLCAGVVYAWQSQSAKPTSLAAYAPSGALLSIESPNFAALLNAWTNSPEQKRWLASGDYAGFSRSRLFDRLGQAQDEFAITAGLAPDIRFLHQIAGSDSLLAWYDIGNLEFLYITRLPPGEAAHTPLLALRANFESRQAGNTTFYVRTTADPARTVAFAVQGDYLLLATREDLIANALQLMQHPGDRTLLHDAWYSATNSATNNKPSDLRMSLNLTKIVRSPYFRSYWVQRNITETKQYTAARSDLYRTADALREERTLITAQPENEPPSTNLSSVLDYLPANIGVYRAQAQPSVDEVLSQLDDKLLTRASTTVVDTRTAPIASLSTPTSGDASDLDERIDTLPATTPSHAATLMPLRNLFAGLSPTAMLTFSTATQPQATASTTPFLNIHTAIVLSSASAWDPTSLQQALTTKLLPQLSVNGSSLTWTPQHDTNSTWYSLSGPQHLVFAVQGNSVILCSDESTLLQLLSANASATHTPRVALVVTGFNHTAERAPYLHLTGMLDHNATHAQPGEDAPPPFFSGNIASLSDTFRDLDTETFTESTAPDHTLHQTVLYQWKH